MLSYRLILESIALLQKIFLFTSTVKNIKKYEKFLFQSRVEDINRSEVDF